MQLPSLDLPSTPLWESGNLGTGNLQGWDVQTPSSTAAPLVDWSDQGGAAQQTWRLRAALGSRGLKRRTDKVALAVQKAKAEKRGASYVPTKSRSDPFLVEDADDVGAAALSPVGEQKLDSSQHRETTLERGTGIPLQSAKASADIIVKRIRKARLLRKQVRQARVNLSYSPRGYYDPASGTERRLLMSTSDSCLIPQTFNVIRAQRASPRDYGSKARNAAAASAATLGINTAKHDIDSIVDAHEWMNCATSAAGSNAAMTAKPDSPPRSAEADSGNFFLTGLADPSKAEAEPVRIPSRGGISVKSVSPECPWHVYGKPMVWIQTLKPRPRDFIDRALDPREDDDETQLHASSQFGSFEVNCEKVKKWDFPKHFECFLKGRSAAERKRNETDRVAVCVMFYISGIRKKEYVPADDIAIKEGILKLLSWMEFNEVEQLDGIWCQFTRAPSIEDISVYKIESLESNPCHLKICAAVWAEKSDAPKAMRKLLWGLDPCHSKSPFHTRVQKGRVRLTKTLAQSFVASTLQQAVRKGSVALDPKSMEKSAAEYELAQNFKVFSSSASKGLQNLRLKMKHSLIVNNALLKRAEEDLERKRKEREASKTKFEEDSRDTQNKFLSMKQTAERFRSTLHDAMFKNEYAKGERIKPRRAYVPRMRWNTRTGTNAGSVSPASFGEKRRGVLDGA